MVGGTSLGRRMVGRAVKRDYRRHLNFLSLANYARWGRRYSTNQHPADSADRYAFL